jgi:hypothetical protein
MTDDLLERLAETDVPPAPADLDVEVHHRLNRMLLVAHLADLGLRGMMYAVTHFARGVLHLLVLTLTGKVTKQ